MYLARMLRKRIRDVRVAGLRSQFTTARSDDDELLAVHGKRARGRVAGRGKARFPEQPSRAFVERAKLRILRRRDEDKAAARDDRSAVLFRSGDWDPARREDRELAERNPPAVFTAVEIDRAERAPRRLDGWEAARVSPTFVADELIGRAPQLLWCPIRRVGRRQLVSQILDQRAFLGHRQIRKRRHETATPINCLLNLLLRSARGEANERWRAVPTAAIAAVTDGAGGC